MKVSKGMLVSAIILFLLGVFIVFSSYQLEIWANIPWNIGACALGASVIGVSIGFLALHISLKSGERMQAMANLEFYEKMAMVQQYIMDLSQPDTDEWNKAYADKIFYDLKGAKQLDKYVDSKIKKELDKKIEELKREAAEDPEKYKDLIEELTSLLENDTR